METAVAIDEVRVRREGRILVITLNRPHSRNAATQAMAAGVAAALDELDADDELSVGIITGGDGSFCAGMDLKGFLRGERPIVDGRGFIGLTQAPPAKPLIAAVEGYALAGGCEAVLACDLVVAAARDHRSGNGLRRRRRGSSRIRCAHSSPPRSRAAPGTHGCGVSKVWMLA